MSLLPPRPAPRPAGPPPYPDVPGRTRVEASTAPAPARLRAWDRLVDSRPGSDVSQLSAWAGVRAAAGYAPLYLSADRDGELVGGALVLRRRVAPGAWIGYLPCGPVLAGPDLVSGSAEAEAVRALAGAVHRVARRHLAFFVQPTEHGAGLAAELLDLSFRRSLAGIAPSATLRVSLTPTVDELRGALPPRLRTWTRQWARRGVQVRLGGPADIRTLAALAALTARHQGFTPLGEGYLRSLYDALAPAGHATVMVAEVDGVPVAAELFTGCGGVLRSRIAGLDRGHPDASRLNVADALIWHTLLWARSRGYREFDFGGLRPESMAALTGPGRPDPAELAAPDLFKTKFGGRPLRYPPALELIRPRPLRLGYDALHHGRVGPRLLGMARSVLRGGG